MSVCEGVANCVRKLINEVETPLEIYGTVTEAGRTVAQLKEAARLKVSSSNGDSKKAGLQRRFFSLPYLFHPPLAFFSPLPFQPVRTRSRHKGCNDWHYLLLCFVIL
jgi:hypothetical protein